MCLNIDKPAGGLVPKHIYVKKPQWGIRGMLCVPCHSRSVIVCSYCNCEVTEQLVHYFHHCSKYRNGRELFWTTVVNTFHVNVITHLFNLCQSEHTEIILGKPPSIFIVEGE